MVTPHHPPLKVFPSIFRACGEGGRSTIERNSASDMDIILTSSDSWIADQKVSHLDHLLRQQERPFLQVEIRCPPPLGEDRVVRCM